MIRWAASVALWLTAPFAGWFAVNLPLTLIHFDQLDQAWWVYVLEALFTGLWIAAYLVSARLHKDDHRKAHYWIGALSFLSAGVIYPLVEFGMGYMGT